MFGEPLVIFDPLSVSAVEGEHRGLAIFRISGSQVGGLANIVASTARRTALFKTAEGEGVCSMDYAKDESENARVDPGNYKL
jgi:hypothetical protein